MVVDGKPYASEHPESGQAEALPIAIRRRDGSEISETGEPEDELNYADVQNGGRNLAFLRIAAGILQVKFDDLRQRHIRRVRRIIGAWLAFGVTIATLASVAYTRTMRSVRIAQWIRQSTEARATSPAASLVLAREALAANGDVLTPDLQNAIRRAVEANSGGARSGDAPLLALSIEPNGNRLVTASKLGTLQEPGSQTPLRVAASDASGVVYLWNLAPYMTSQEAVDISGMDAVAKTMIRLPGHEGSTQIAFMGSLLASAGTDGTVRVWQTRDSDPTGSSALTAAPDERRTDHGDRYQLMFFVIVLFSLTGYLSKQAERIRAGQRVPEKILPGADAAFVLYLRGFADEDRPAQPRGMLGMLTDPTSVEEAFLGRLAAQFRVVALANVARQGLPSPYAIAEVDAEHWKERVTELIPKAKLVVAQVGTTPGLTWEFAELVRADALTRSVFVFHPGTAKEHQARWEAMLDVRNDGARVFPRALSTALQKVSPPWQMDDTESARAIAIDGDLTPVSHSSHSHYLGYEFIADEVLKALRTRDAMPKSSPSVPQPSHRVAP